MEAEEERRRLVWYLAALANKLARLPLRGLEERLDQGNGLALPRVYVMLATKTRVEVGYLSIVVPFPRSDDERKAVDERKEQYFNNNLIHMDSSVSSLEGKLLPQTYKNETISPWSPLSFSPKIFLNKKLTKLAIFSTKIAIF